MRVLWAAMVVLWAGVAWGEDVIVTQEGNSTHITTPGNLAPTQDPGCIRLDEARADLAPPDLLLGIVDCLKASRAEEAADLYVLMVLRVRFDAERVTDTSAHQAGRVLQMQLESLISATEVAALQFALEANGAPGSVPWSETCGRLRATGVPGHDPGYMIFHGIKAISGNGGAPLVDPFDAKAAWEDVMTGFARCPSS